MHTYSLEWHALSAQCLFVIYVVVAIKAEHSWTAYHQDQFLPIYVLNLDVTKTNKAIKQQLKFKFNTLHRNHDKYVW